jgi:quercetin dioxygenase-like cupin family protein
MLARSQIRSSLLGMTCLLVSVSPAGPASAHETDADALTTPAVLFENERVTILRASTGLGLSSHPAAVVVFLDSGEAYWSGDLPHRVVEKRPLIIVVPKGPAGPPAAPAGTAAAGPLAVPPPGFSFQPLFENDRVSVIRGRMEANAKEGLHTHSSDIVVVHLSGGTIEDTAEGKTKINRGKPGDVEFEARGSSHSARNRGPAVQAVLVTLKP